MEYTFYVDGASSNNGMPGAKGGWAWIRIHNEEVVAMDLGHIANGTNNQGEMMAIIEALKYCKILLKEDIINKETVINIYSDSSYCIKGITEWIAGWKRNNWKNSAKKPVKNKELWEEMDTLRQGFRINWKKVLGHSGDKWNDKVDELAVKARKNEVAEEKEKAYEVFMRTRKNINC